MDPSRRFPAGERTAWTARFPLDSQNLAVGGGSRAESSGAWMLRHSETVSNTIVSDSAGEKGFQSRPGCDGLPVRAKLIHARDTLSCSA